MPLHTMGMELHNLSHQRLNHGGGRGSCTDASCLNHGGGGGTGFRDRSAAIGGNSSRINAAKQLQSAPLKTEPHTKTPNSCEFASFRKICNGSYTSGGLRDKGTLIAGKEGNRFMIGFVERSTRVSIRDFHFWLWV